MKINPVGPTPDTHQLRPMEQRLNDLLRNADPSQSVFSVMVAYADENFKDHIGDALKGFVEARGTVQAIIGIDSGGTSKGALQWLLGLLDAGSLHVYHNPADATFHPKLYIIKESVKAYVFVGSSNLTGGGLSRNFEMNVEVELDLQEENDRACLSSFENIIGATIGGQSCLELDASTLGKIDGAGVLKKKRSSHNGETSITKKERKTLSSLFGKTRHTHTKPTATRSTPATQSFIMSLVSNDVIGRRWDKYFLIPIAARNQNRRFWGWPSRFRQGRTPGVLERYFDVQIKIGRKTISEQGRLSFYPGVDEFRFKSKTIYGLGSGAVGSFLIISWSTGQTGPVANLELVSTGTQKHAALSTLPFQKVGSLQKMFTYA